jgi:hypothetical protein
MLISTAINIIDNVIVAPTPLLYKQAHVAKITLSAMNHTSCFSSDGAIVSLLLNLAQGKIRV